ncbi:MAG: hypothetical protein ACRDVG_11595 [Jatrophihabitantaceae bacterium]
MLVYLDEPFASDLLAAITAASAPGSRIALERGDAARSPVPGSVELLWRGGLGGRVADRLAAHGWRTSEHELSEVAAAYGRPTRSDSRSGFVTADYRPAG